MVKRLSDKEAVFIKLKKCLKKCTPPMVSKNHPVKGFELIGNKPVPYGSQKKIVPGMYFVSAAMRKNSVVFYYFPGYLFPELYQSAPALAPFLKGKTCFHFKKATEVNEKEMMILLRKGISAWKKKGYLK